MRKFCLCFLTTILLNADTFTLRDGTRLDGQWLGADGSAVKILVQGSVRDIPRDTLVRVTFGSTVSPIQPAPKPAAPETVAPTETPAVATQVDSPHPVLQFSSYTSLNGAFSLPVSAFDKDGNVLLAGSCGSTFPTLVKVSPDGKRVLDVRVFIKVKLSVQPCYVMPYVGFNFPDTIPNQERQKMLDANPAAYITAMKVDKAGRIFLAGNTVSSPAFPVVNGFRSAAVGRPDKEVFVIALAPDAKTVLYSTLLGGSGDEYLGGIDVDNKGGLWITGHTYSRDFPRVSSLYDFHEADVQSDAFVTHLDPAGKPRFSTYFGTVTGDEGDAVAVGPDGDVVVLGTAFKVEGLPVTPNAVEKIGGGFGRRAFLAKFSAKDYSLIWCTLVGKVDSPGTGAAWRPAAVVIDSKGSPIVAGSLIGGQEQFPNIADPERLLKVHDIQSAAIVKLSRDGDSYIFTKLLGKSLTGNAITSLAVDGGDNILAVGQSSGFDAFPGQKSWKGLANDPDYSGFLLKYSPEGRPLWKTSLTGKLPQNAGLDVAEYSGVSVRNGAILLSGITKSHLHPTTAASFEPDWLPGDSHLRPFAMKFAAEPGADDCEISAGPSTIHVSNEGGQDFGFYAIPSRGSCTWEVSTPDRWLKVTRDAATFGTGFVKVDVETNVDAERTGRIVVRGSNGKEFVVRVTQRPVACAVGVVPVLIQATGMSVANLPLTAGKDCPPPTFSSDAKWIQVAPAKDNLGNTIVSIKAQPNPDMSPRKAIGFLNGSPMWFLQAGPPN